MYKHVFQNSKAALLFAGATLIGAVSLVGTPEDSGVVIKAVDLVESQRNSFAGEAQAFAEGQSVGDKPPAQPVFGDFAGTSGPSTSDTAVEPGPANPMDAPLSSTAIVEEPGSTSVTGVPFIAEREMTIEPE